MQGKSEQPRVLAENRTYNGAMPRTLNRPRPIQGDRLLRMRMDAGLSQAELGRLLGETQQNIAFWEQSDKPPRSDVLPKLSQVLGVSVEEILTGKNTNGRRGGPVGKVKKVFDEVSKLPRRKQDKIVEFVSALINQYKQAS